MATNTATILMGLQLPDMICYLEMNTCSSNNILHSLGKFIRNVKSRIYSLL